VLSEGVGAIMPGKENDASEESQTWSGANTFFSAICIAASVAFYLKE
jgi:hypothetical protein